MASRGAVTPSGPNEFFLLSLFEFQGLVRRGVGNTWNLTWEGRMHHQRQSFDAPMASGVEHQSSAESSTNSSLQVLRATG